MSDDNHTSATNEPLSKSAKKREAERLQSLGRRLCELSADKLSSLALPDALYAALLDYQRFPSHGAKRRQLQFIGKMMRDLDVSVIEAELSTMEGESAEARYQFKQLERWRDLLISDPDSLTTFIEAYPEVDRQALRSLIKKATTAKNDNLSKAAARTLFRFLREVDDNHRLEDR
jgi:ribosome-associated protein